MTAPVAAVSVFCPTPATCNFAPLPLLAVTSSRPPHRSLVVPDSVSVTVFAVVSWVRTVHHHTETVEPSVALAFDWEYSPAFVQILFELASSATDEWSVVAPSVALRDDVAKTATANWPTAMVPVTATATVLALVARAVSPRTVMPENAIG